MAGRLLVTTLAIHYRSDRLDSLLRGDSGDWKCELRDIASVSIDPGGSRRLRGNGPAGFRRKIVIEAQTGDEVRLVVSDPDATYALITKAMETSVSGS